MFSLYFCEELFSLLCQGGLRWATVNIWYIAPSHQFLKSVLSFLQILVYEQMLSFFEEYIIVFQAPAQFPKNKDVSNTTLY